MQRQSGVCRQNRAALKYPHRMGSKPYAEVEEEMVCTLVKYLNHMKICYNYFDEPFISTGARIGTGAHLH